MGESSSGRGYVSGTRALVSSVAVLIVLGWFGLRWFRPAESLPVSKPPPFVQRPASPNEGLPVIDGVSPPVLQVVDGHAGGELTVRYRILNAHKVTKAVATLRGEDAGLLAQADAPIAEEGSVTFRVPTGLDFGPTIRFRNRCSRGTTDWATWGRMPVFKTETERQAFAIQSISNRPLHTRAGPGFVMSDPKPDSGTNVTLTGPFDGSCVPEATLNGQPMPLEHVQAWPNRTHAFVRGAPYDFRPIHARYLEATLSIDGAGFGYIAIERVPFSD